VARLVFLSHEYANFQLSLPADFEQERRSVEDVPAADDLQGFDYLLLLGSLTDGNWARQFTGLLRRLIPEGLVVIVAHHPIPGDVVAYFLQRLEIETAPMPDMMEVTAMHPAFRGYFDLFGQAQTAVDADGQEVLGRASDEDDDFPASIHAPRGQGAVYTVPFYFAGAERQFGELLLGAVEAHRADAPGRIPPFLSPLRLPGEQDVLDRIATTEQTLDGLRGEAEGYQRFRLLLGPRGTGGALEEQVIEALNVILDGSEYRAEDRADVRVEDFWIVGADGDVALSEVKGINSNVRRDDVNQVDNNREVLERDPEFPGLLIVNIFRGRDSLEDRQLPVSEQVVHRAASSNVLILRTYDLYQLIARKYAGEPAADELIRALLSGLGGWLEVNRSGAEHHH
jgi:hypothetical protein